MSIGVMESTVLFYKTKKINGVYYESRNLLASLFAAG
jgi:hypothetical protein